MASAGVGDEHGAAVLQHARHERGELRAVALLVEHVRRDDEREAAAAERPGVVPAQRRRLQPHAVARGVLAQELERVLGPVGREHPRPAHRRGERRQPQPAAELEQPQAAERTQLQVARERHSARPDLRPVGQELVPGERVFADERLRSGRTAQHELAPAEHDPLLHERRHGI
ncbi:MAG TPA: hypothetical protein VFB26_04645 [Gaiellaceae bacterium]|nr:hypothetical protein [Gaiellaceae bacterium]